MTLEQALYNYLASAPAGLVTLLAGRIYPLTLPQEAALPAVSYQRISTTGMRTMGAPRLGREATFQFDVWATSHASRLAVTDALRVALDGYSGTMGGAGGVDVLAVQMQNDQDGYEPLTKAYRGIVEFKIWHHD
jgi:hypothetical protein